MHMDGCQGHGLFLGTLNLRVSIVMDSIDDPPHREVR